MSKKRSHGLGHLHKRGNFYYYRYMVNGKVNDVSLKVTTEDEAEKIIKEQYLPIIQAKSKEQLAVHIAESRKLISKINNVKLSDTWEFYLNSPNRPDSSKGTLKSYQSAFNDLLSFLEKSYPSIINFSQISEDVAHKYAQYLWNERKVSERTYNAYIKALHLVYRVLLPKELNPFSKENIARKNENQQGHHKLSEKEILKVLDCFNNEELFLLHKDEMKVLFYLGALTGLRLADCCLLKWDNISFTDEIIRCIPQKTYRIKRKAIIPMTSILKEQLQIASNWKIEGNNYVLHNIAERYIRNPDGIRKDCIRIFQFAGFKTTEDKGDLQRKKDICRYGFHSFRHSFASIMASNGYNITMLAQILADDTKTLEKYYINIDDKVIKKTFNNIFLMRSNVKFFTMSSEENRPIDDIIQMLQDKNPEQLSRIRQFITNMY